MDNYYVYTHRDPLNGHSVVYVGRGRRDRAWQCRSTQRMNPEHVEWLKDLQDGFGYTMAAVVRIEAQALSKEDASQIEIELIDKYKPYYNRPIGGPRQITDEEVALAKQLRDKGLSYSDIAEETNFTTMTIWRALNGKTKSIQDG